MRLKPRLKMISDMISAGSVVADIGTDHAFLPAYLLVNNRCRRAIASDLRKGPLANAEETVTKYALSGSISLRLSDGLDAFSPGEFTHAVFAGMGGILISELIARCEWIYSPDYKIIAQPMTHSEDLRRFFILNGFRIEEERACFDEGKPYIAMLACYDGKVRKKDEKYYFFGPHPIESNEASGEYARRQLRRAVTRLNALRASGGNEEELRLLELICEKAKESFDDSRS